MYRRPHTLLLLLLTLAVATAPLRGAWALPDAGVPAAAPHCADMQQAMPQADHSGHHDIHTERTEPCRSGCDGACCDQACGVCLHHSTPGLPLATIVLTDRPAHAGTLPAIDSIPERPPTPPLRPPHALHS